MAFLSPAAVFLDENQQMHRGRKADTDASSRARPPNPPAKKPGLQQRKALRDVSNQAPSKVGRQGRKALLDVSNNLPISALKERPTVKERSGLHSQEATKDPNKTAVLADKDTTKCHEWAKEGVEGAHFTGNDSQKLDKNVQDRRVKRKVEKVVSALRCWSDVVFDPVMFPAKEVAKFSDELKGLEQEPEILPDINRRLFNSCRKAKLAEDPFTDDDDELDPFLDKKPVEFELKDDEPGS